MATEPPLGTLERGLAILGLFSAEHPHWSFRGIAEASGLPKATARRLVVALERLGWLEQEANGEFSLGPQILHSLYAKTSTSVLVTRARPHLERLAALTTETALIAAWGYEGAITLDLVSTPRHFKPFTSVGMVMRGAATADAQVLIAFSPETTWDARFDSVARHSPGVTEADRASMKAGWRDVRDAGIAHDREQWREGVYAMAVPVLDTNGYAMASLSIVMPSERANGAALDASAHALRDAAEAISAP